MNVKSKLVSVIGAAIISLSMVSGAAAQTSTASVPVDVKVNTPSGSGVSWTVTGGGSAFTEVTASFTEPGASTGSLTLNVSDNRFTREGWSISMAAQDFQGKTSAKTIPAGNFTLKPQGVQVQTGDQTPLPTAQQVTMSATPQEVLSANLGSGSGLYSVQLDGTIVVPVNTQADTYTTTITVSGSTAP